MAFDLADHLTLVVRFPSRSPVMTSYLFELCELRYFTWLRPVLTILTEKKKGAAITEAQRICFKMSQKSICQVRRKSPEI